jgi:hypothetical protein
MCMHGFLILKYIWLREKTKQVFQDIKNIFLRIKKSLFYTKPVYQPVYPKYGYTCYPNYSCGCPGEREGGRDETD